MLWTQLDPRFSQSAINKVVTNCYSTNHLSPKHVIRMWSYRLFFCTTFVQGAYTWRLSVIMIYLSLRYYGIAPHLTWDDFTRYGDVQQTEIWSDDKNKFVSKWRLKSTETIRLIRDGEKVGKGVWRWGKMESMYLSLHYYIKMGSDESHFHVS